MLFPALQSATTKEALRFGDRTLTYADLALVAGALAHRLRRLDHDRPRVAIWATASLETSVATVAALLAGVPAVPINPKAGERELAHIVSDSTPALVLAPPGTDLPSELHRVAREDVSIEGGAGDLPPEVESETPALIVYTSGTTGPPKGVVLPRRAIASTLDALEDAWQWTADDVLVHALPLFHVHGLILAILGPLRRGGTVHHIGRFSTQQIARELTGEATMMFGVPTMYHRIASEVATDHTLANALRDARLLVSGSAALPMRDHQLITEATGQQVVERYGMTETLMNTSVRADGPRKPGTVGPPLRGVELRLIDEDGNTVELGDTETVGEIQVRGPNLFTGYLNRPDATAEAFDGDWFRTGDMATRDTDGYVRIVGRKATDLIKSGGYKIGAGEIENALLEHPGVAEVAVTGEPDPDLGERIVAWVVPSDEPAVKETELVDHVAKLLSPHKRPRAVRFLGALPRNHMGKVMKRALDT
ncbi:acyl-CoA synthetase [Saccharomonospora amisosensis]|uniref:acyl-CoA synthetase n=1 Tax=Saccharomonospora amisosensis TaxID=1128677 RepID=UPI0028BD3186|nr:acyl-CoA synthetase [Saccharomonospora amisosensis]